MANSAVTNVDLQKCVLMLVPRNCRPIDAPSLIKSACVGIRELESRRGTLGNIHLAVIRCGAIRHEGAASFATSQPRPEAGSAKCPQRLYGSETVRNLRRQYPRSQR